MIFAYTAFSIALLCGIALAINGATTRSAEIARREDLIRRGYIL